MRSPRGVAHNKILGCCPQAEVWSIIFTITPLLYLLKRENLLADAMRRRLVIWKYFMYRTLILLAPSIWNVRTDPIIFASRKNSLIGRLCWPVRRPTPLYIQSPPARENVWLHHSSLSCRRLERVWRSYLTGYRTIWSSDVLVPALTTQAHTRSRSSQH